MSLVFSTPRLVVRPWELDDAPRMFDMLRRPEVSRWTSNPAPMADVAEAEAKIASYDRTYAAGEHLGIWTMALRENPTRSLGTILVRPLPGTEEQTTLTDVETGWSLHPDAQGSGYATEAARGALEHAFRHGHQRVWAVMWSSNERSAAVCERLRMTHLGVVDDPWYGTPEDPTSRMYRADADTWSP